MDERCWAWPLPAFFAAGLTACDDCDRGGCDAVTQRAAPGGAEIAGVVAQQSDVSRDGCLECPLAAATLLLWTVPEPFESSRDAVALVTTRAPDLTIEVEGSYRQPLARGWYLLSAGPNAVELNVHEDETLTVNVLLRDGPTSFFVGRPSSTRLLEEDFGFDVSSGAQGSALR